MTLTPDTILAGTRVLAEFEGIEIFSTDKVHWFIKKGYATDIHELSYHTSYDALHGAWRVFRSLDQTQFTEAQKCDFLQHRERIVRAFGYDSIEKCFSLLVEAVEWLQKTKGGSDVH